MRRLIGLLLILLLRPAWAAGPVAEYEMKATFLYNFAIYTDWPTNPGENFNLCILGQDNFGTALKRIEGKLINGKPILVARLSSLAQIRKCQMLFVSEREAGNMSRILFELDDAPVLTVSEALSTPMPAITLLLDGQRLVFDIALQRARSARLSLSSKLLQLARSVQ